MASATFLSNDGNDRLVIKTICTHFIFFHEAGFEFRTERKQGLLWRRNDEVEQPRDVQCTFDGDKDPATFGATPQASTGFFKLTCDHMSIRRNCIHVVDGADAPAGPEIDANLADVRTVRSVMLEFSYGGQRRTLSHRQ